MNRILCAALLAGAAGPAWGGELGLEAMREAECPGVRQCIVDGAEITAGPGEDARLVEQSYRGIIGLGVALTDTEAPRDREIQGPIAEGDVPGERLTVAFDAPRRIDRIAITHLFNPGVPGDPQEEALIEGHLAGESLGTLSIRSLSDEAGGFDVGDLGLVATVLRESPEAGTYVIVEPFGGEVDRLVFRAGRVESGDTSDYSLMGIVSRPAE